MPVPKRRRSRSKRGMQRAHKKLHAPTVATCPSCGESKLPHRICPSCGQYKDRAYQVNVVH